MCGIVVQTKMGANEKGGNWYQVGVVAVKKRSAVTIIQLSVSIFVTSDGRLFIHVLPESAKFQLVSTKTGMREKETDASEVVDFKSDSL